jgi:hypothetical protein
MKTNQYKTKYHLIVVVYFGREFPSGHDLASIWSAMGALPDLSVETSIHLQGDPKRLRLRQESSTIGSRLLGEILESNSDRLASVSASSGRRDAYNTITDSDFNFSFQSSGIWEGESVCPYLILSISNSVVEQTGPLAILEVIRKTFEISGKYSPESGFVDLSRPWNTYAGMTYGTVWPRTAPLHLWIEQIKWMSHASKKADRVRGLYWGNYLGPRIIDRLGGWDVFREIFETNARNYDRSENAHLWKMNDGLFVSLSLDPVDASPTNPMGVHPAVEVNAKWLIRELGTKGILDSW